MIWFFVYELNICVKSRGAVIKPEEPQKYFRAMEGVDDVTRTAGTVDTPANAAAKPPPLRAFFDGQRFLIWNPREAFVLRCAHRIVGGLVGALPTNKRQNVEMGLPVALLFEETLLAVEEGLIHLFDARDIKVGASETAGAAASSARQQRPSSYCSILTECASWAQLSLPLLSPAELKAIGSNTDLRRARVYRALWQRGFFSTPGSGFGADYLCYQADPFRHHAHMLVHIAAPGRQPRAVEVTCIARLAASVKKTACLAICNDDTDVCLHEIHLNEVGTAHLSSQMVSTIATIEAATVEALSVAGLAPPSSSKVSANDANGVSPEMQKLRLVYQSNALVESNKWRGVHCTELELDSGPPSKVARLDHNIHQR
jgi:tRNA splicing endonuclease